MLCKFTGCHLQHGIQSVKGVLLKLRVFTFDQLKPGRQLHLLQAEQTRSLSIHVLHDVEYVSLHCAK